MKKLLPPGVLFSLALLSACGVPRAALDQARVAATQTASTDADIRQNLLAQSQLWQTFSDTLHRRELGGLWGVDASFITSIEQIAAIARRQAELIHQNADDPTLNRALFEEFQNRWRQVQTYLDR